MISKMNKLSFLIYHKEYEMFLEKLRELGVVHIEKREGAEMDANLQAFMNTPCGLIPKKTQSIL